MERFYGAVGYAEQQEVRAGSWKDIITERMYTGDVLRHVSKTRDGEGLNDNLVTDNRISIVADPYAYENFFLLRYICWHGAKWKVMSVDVQRPRLILTIGGVYNEQT